MGQYPAVANFMHNVYDRITYDPLRGIQTRKKIQDPVGTATKVLFVADVPKARAINPKTSGLFDTDEYRKAYEARWLQAYDTPVYRHLNSGFNVDPFNETRMKTLEGKTLHTGVQGIVDESHYSIVSQRIRQ